MNILHIKEEAAAIVYAGVAHSEMTVNTGFVFSHHLSVILYDVTCKRVLWA